MTLRNFAKKNIIVLLNMETFNSFAETERKILTYGGNVVVLFNGFQKKTQKTPENEIEMAIKIKKQYYADK